jgi:hypothetical protein
MTSGTDLRGDPQRLAATLGRGFTAQQGCRAKSGQHDESHLSP